MSQPGETAASGEGERTAPWWTTPHAVAGIAAIYFLVFAAISLLLGSALGVDDAIENEAVQTLSINYSSRNPPLYDWILYGVQQVLGPGREGFVLVRYMFLFVCVLLIHAIARRAIADPRLQALSVFSLTLLWVFGYHAHRILTHSQPMVVAIAGATLTVLLLRERTSAVRYAALGGWIAVGVLGKFGFIAFIAMLVAGMLSEPSYRKLLLDRRIVLTVIVAGLPVAAYAAASVATDYNLAGAVTYAADVGRRASLGSVLAKFVQSWFGFFLPFLAVFLAIFFIRTQWKTEPQEESRDAAYRLLRNMTIAGTAIALVAVVASATMRTHSRYFLVFYLLAPIYAFAVVDRMAVSARQVTAFLGITLAVAAGVAITRASLHLAPDPRLCGACRESVPYPGFAKEFIARYGDRPTLVTAGGYFAGQFRAVIPEARIRPIVGRQGWPPPRDTKGCYFIFSEEHQDERVLAQFAEAAASSGLKLDDADVIEVPWWTPLLPREGRTTQWNVLSVPEENPVCQ